ncbi:hypothetical protein HJC23_009355 [Cyclotella cryptica]|uniref:Cyclin N-terminal domain-containing protein n=1 Tax=Cyclotella cryptica TaxID=29204 RepID=A0ABD3QUX3_9STRA|eukprot:CCRYP_002353-RA/>CCRYP_002353-RA protein AED:0.30 eAED:0.30 QI:0/-1/0/1/-1/1/1/0/285
MIQTDVFAQLCVMQNQEQNAYRCFDYMDLAETMVYPSDRQALCNWGYRTIAACPGVERSTVAVAILYFDRFLSTSNPIAKWALNDRRELQLAFVACLVIALKVHSGLNVELDFVSRVICNDMYDTEEIIMMEREVLEGLEWRLNGPIPHDFIDRFLCLLPPNDSINFEFLSHFSKSLVEHALTVYSVALTSPSSIAFSSIFCSLQYMDTLSPLTNLSILQFLEVVMGLDMRDPHVQATCIRMTGLLQECSCNSVASVLGVQAERRISETSNDEMSVAGEASPRTA